MYWPMALFYSIGGLFAFLLTLQNLYKDSVNFGFQEISFSATIYYIFCVFLLFEPIRREKSNYEYDGKIDSKNLRLLCILFIIVSFFYTIAIIPFVNVAFNTLDAVAYHNDMLEQGGVDIAHGNLLLTKIFFFQEILRPIFIFLACYILCDNRFSNKFKFVLCTCCIIPTILDSMASSSRNTMFFCLIDFFIGFLLFYQKYSKNIKRNVIIISSILGVIVAIIVVVFAFMRFSDTVEGNIVSYSLYRYAGEPIVNFNTMLWEIVGKKSRFSCSIMKIEAN